MRTESKEFRRLMWRFTVVIWTLGVLWGLCVVYLISGALR